MKRLYIVVRNDIHPGLQFAQGVHACNAFEQTFPELYKAWVKGSNNVVCVQVPDEPALAALLAQNEGQAVGFHEPDLDGQLTAIAVSDKGKGLGGLSLALKYYHDVRRVA